MKTFKLFIQAVDFKKLIESQCGPFLTESGRQGLLFRGIYDKDIENSGAALTDAGEELRFTTLSVRQDREPYTMNKKMHDAINFWFKDRFGFKARSAAMFCIGEAGKLLTFGYGDGSHTVFPKGDFTYVWSPQVKDLWYITSDWARNKNVVVDGVVNKRNLTSASIHWVTPTLILRMPFRTSVKSW